MCKCPGAAQVAAGSEFAGHALQLRLHHPMLHELTEREQMLRVETQLKESIDEMEYGTLSTKYQTLNTSYTSYQMHI
jgi:hypothetical protein